MLVVAFQVLFLASNIFLHSLITGFIENNLFSTVKVKFVNTFLFTFYCWWRFFSTIYIYNIISAIFHIDLGIHKAFVSCLDSIFQLVGKNEEMFLCLKGDVMSSQKALVNGNNKIKSPRLDDKISHENAKNKASLTAQELAECFQVQDLDRWNLISYHVKRNGKIIPLTFIGKLAWFSASILRYGLLIPLRFTLTLTSLGYFTCCLLLATSWLESEYERFFLSAHRVLKVAVGGVLILHNEGNSPSNGGVCVSNHTCPMDIVFAANHRVYSFFGRFRDGYLGFIYQSLSNNGGHLWFDLKQRDQLPKRIEERAKDENNFPIIIYPEGTCTSSHCIMRFRKGWFEHTPKVYPLAMKYDTRYGPVFWDSRKGILRYIWQLCNNWAVVCNMHFLPVEYCEEKESPFDYADRVRDKIAKMADLKKIDADGYKTKYSN